MTRRNKRGGGNGSKKSLKIQNKTLKKNTLKKNTLKGGVFYVKVSLKSLYAKLVDIVNINALDSEDYFSQIEKIASDMVELLKFYNDFSFGYHGSFYRYDNLNRDIRIGINKLEDKTNSYLVRLNPNPFSSNSSYYLERNVIRKFFYHTVEKNNEEYSFIKFFKLASEIIAPQLFQTRYIESSQLEPLNLEVELLKYKKNNVIEELLGIDFLEVEFSKTYDLMVREKQTFQDDIKKRFQKYIVEPLREEILFIIYNIDILKESITEMYEKKLL